MGERLTIGGLATETGRRREEVIRWLTNAHLYYQKEFLSTKEACIEEINKHRMRSDSGAKARFGGAEDKEPDGETGLPWKDALDREKTIELRRLNRIAEKTESGDYMPTAVHFERLSLLCGKIEQVPDKARSELGLTDLQTVKLTKMLDECREEAAKEVRCSTPITNPPSEPPAS